jgi:tetratricopeptide (TPR) repeat protein
MKSRELFKIGKDCFERREYTKALKVLNEIVECEEDDKELLSDTFYLMANIFHLKGEIGKAIKGFNKSISLNPAHTDASISLSVLYNDIGRYEEAKRVFETANERVRVQDTSQGVKDEHINKKFALKHFELAEMYLTYNRLDEAMFEYNKANKLDPENLEARIKIAKVYAKKNFITKAFDELRKLKNENPNYMPARIAMGVLLYGQGKVVEAQSEWQRVLAKEPSNKEANMYLNLSNTATETSVF